MNRLKSKTRTIYVKNSQEKLFAQARVLAAKEGTSLSRVIQSLLRDWVAKEEAKRAHLLR